MVLNQGGVAGTTLQVSRPSETDILVKLLAGAELGMLFWSVLVTAVFVIVVRSDI